jgi:hypothetical protein
MDMLPDRKVGVVVLTNRALSPVTTILCHAVFDRVSGQDPAPWFDRFAQRLRDFLAQQGNRRYAHEVACRPDTRPSHEMTEYAGTYEHPGYGLIAIDAKGDMLHWRYRDLAGLLNHRHYDVFEVAKRPESRVERHVHSHLPLRGRQRAADQGAAALAAEGLGPTLGQAYRRSEGAHRGRPQVGRHPALHLDRRHRVLVDARRPTWPYAQSTTPAPPRWRRRPCRDGG